jgi:hypothetical protein
MKPDSCLSPRPLFLHAIILNRQAARVLAPKLDRDILLQTLAGYAQVNRFTAAERRARLKRMTDAKSLAVVASLCETWTRSGRQAAGNREALARRELEHKLQLRQAFEALARSKGLTRLAEIVC